MDTIFMNLENSKTSEPHILILKGYLCYKCIFCHFLP